MSVILNIIIAGALAVRANKKVEECYAITAMLAAFALYITGLYWSFIPGIFLFVVILFVSAGYLAYVFFRDRTRIKRALATPGFFFLLTCMFIFALYCYGRAIDHSDDFYCWDLRIKNFLYFGKIRGVPNTDLGTHPPIVGVWNYLAAKTWIRKPSHPLYLWTQNMLLVSFFSPIFRKIDKRQTVLKSVLTSIILLLIPTLDGNAYHTLLVDTMLGAVVFFCFYSFIAMIQKKTMFWMLGFGTGMCFLVLTKQSGSIFFVIILFICCQSSAWYKDRIVFKTILGTIALGWLLTFSWYKNGNAFYIVVGGSIAAMLCGSAIGLIRQHSWKNVKSMSLATCAALMAEAGALVLGGIFVFNHYEESLVHLKYVIEVVTTYSQPSFIESVIDILIIAGLITAVTKWKSVFSIEAFAGTRNGWHMGVACMSYAIGVVGYLLIIWYLEIVSIGPSNGGLTGLNIRYFLPLLTPLYGMILYIVLEMDFTYTAVALTVMMLATHAFSNEEKTNYFIVNKPRSLEFNEFERNNITLTSNDHVFFIDEHDDYIMADRAFYNYICPATSQFTSYEFIQGGLKPEMEETEEELEEILLDGNYNYVYIQLISDSSAEKYQELFESNEAIGGGRLYAVVHTGDGIQLRWLSGRRES